MTMSDKQCLFFFALIALLGLGCCSTSLEPNAPTNANVIRAFDAGRKAWESLHPEHRETPYDWSISRSDDGWSICPTPSKSEKKLKSGHILYGPNPSSGNQIRLDCEFRVTASNHARTRMAPPASKTRILERVRLAAALEALGKLHSAPRHSIFYMLNRAGLGWSVSRFVLDQSAEPKLSFMVVSGRRVYLSSDGQVSQPLKLSLWDLAYRKEWVWEVVEEQETPAPK